MTLELDLIADLQTARTVEYLNVGIIAYNFDDLGHHSGLTAPYVANFVLTNCAVSLHDHDVRDDTRYSPCCLH